MRQGGQGDHEDQKDPTEGKTNRERGHNDISVGKSNVGVVLPSPSGSCWDHPAVLHPLWTSGSNGRLDVLSYLCHPHKPPLAHPLWIPTDSSSVISAPPSGSPWGQARRFLQLISHHSHKTSGEQSSRGKKKNKKRESV